MSLITMKEKTFNLFLVGLFLLAASGIALVNFVINPFAVFPVGQIPGYSDVHFVENVRIYKNFWVKNRSFNGLMLGSSRIEESMTPMDTAWPDMQVYNMAMPGSSLPEILRTLQHAHNVTPIKQGLIGLDFFMFSAYMEQASDFSEDNFSVDAQGNKKHGIYVLRTYANLLFSSDAFEKSLDTIKDSKKRAAPSHDKTGAVSIAVHNAAVKDNAAVYKVFDSFENSYFRKNGFWLNGPNSTYTTVSESGGQSTYDDYRTLLEYIYQNDLNIQFVISPLHVRMQLGLDGIGLWPAFTDWKKQLAKINEEVAAAHNLPPKEIWDFAVISNMTTELLPNDPRLPAPTDGLRWFWDPAHAKPAFGAVMQDRIFISQQEDIGRILRTKNVE